MVGCKTQLGSISSAPFQGWHRFTATHWHIVLIHTRQRVLSVPIWSVSVWRKRPLFTKADVDTMWLMCSSDTGKKDRAFGNVGRSLSELYGDIAMLHLTQQHIFFDM